MSAVPAAGSRTLRVDHLARVEGHGGITVRLDGGEVADVHFDVFEGIRLIEGLVLGRSWRELSPIVSRICAICSVAHALTSIRVTERVFGVRPSRQVEWLRDLLWRGENIESHALHLFLLAAPDYLGYDGAVEMAADHPHLVTLGLRLKRLGNRIQEVVGGRAIHPVNAVPGGFGAVPDVAALAGLRAELEEAGELVERMLDLSHGLPPEAVVDSPTTYAALRPTEGYRYDLGSEVVFLRDGERTTVPAGALRDAVGERAVPHSHAKHACFDGAPFMVGALARLAVNRDRLPERGEVLIGSLGLTLPSCEPLDNNRAQAVELALDVQRAWELVETLLDEGVRDEVPPPVAPRAGTATVVTEAPRGLLLHSYTFDDDGNVTAADVITPTAFNAASVEARFRSAVARVGVGDEPVLIRALEMIARAYDPCISCSVHLVRGR